MLGVSDDARALAEPDRGVVAWQLAEESGRLVREGVFPAVTVGGTPVRTVADPVSATGPGPECRRYAGALIGTGTPADTDHLVSAVGIFASPQATLTGGCRDGGCWPTARAVAVAPPGRFYDKEWFDVGRSGAAGTVVWVVWTDRPATDPTAGVAMAERCGADLVRCTPPQRLSDPGDGDPEFTDVVVAASGRVYLTWRALSGTGAHTVMTVKMRVAAPGSTVLGPSRTVAVDPRVMPLGGRLNGDDLLRADSYPKLDVAALPSDGERAFVAWDSCGARVGTVCEESRVLLSWSDDQGRHWTAPRPTGPRAAGSRFFPTLSVDRSTGRLAISYYSTENDPVDQHGLDVYTDLWDTSGPRALHRYRITTTTTEPADDPSFPQSFLGSYFQTVAVHGTAYTDFTASYRHQRLDHRGVPVPQLDNYLAVVSTGNDAPDGRG